MSYPTDIPRTVAHGDRPAAHGDRPAEHGADHRVVCGVRGMMMTSFGHMSHLVGNWQEQMKRQK